MDPNTVTTNFIATHGNNKMIDTIVKSLSIPVRGVLQFDHTYDSNPYTISFKLVGSREIHLHAKVNDSDWFLFQRAVIWDY